jgi:hypothetical protein
VKRAICFLALAITLFAVTAAGCQSESGLEIRPAPIHEVQVNIAESYPQQILVYIKGGLSDGCTAFHDLTVKRSGKTINIKVTTERPQNAICPQVYGYFEESVNLGSDFTFGETYKIVVNDKTTSFGMP